MKKEDIKLTENTIENIQIMAPMLNERQQAIVFGMILGMVPAQSDLRQQAEKEMEEGSRELQEV
ncbi:hypothetical protein [Eisenbergiella tayi]|uniref:hypothetical protein n=1 Tax=Eisenbergiella tayi TaxID=1432052 RepID=UPI000848C2C5|nr:hypothetical protein [Eisenbergiella tayi]ODR35464.1 hypothetical protein BEI60_16170 [Eisenbergiella tayi]